MTRNPLLQVRSTERVAALTRAQLVQCIIALRTAARANRERWPNIARDDDALATTIGAWLADDYIEHQWCHVVDIEPGEYDAGCEHCVNPDPMA